MKKKETAELNWLEEFCTYLAERINGDVCVEYCNDDEEPEDIKPQIEMAADHARYDVANRRLCELKAKRKAEREKKKAGNQ
jgi:hypothetical protein